MRLEWVTTYPSGRAHTHTADDGQTGWRLHAVEVAQDELVTNESLGRKPALCGCRPRTGWGVDLFITEPCARCVERAKKLALDLPWQIEQEYQISKRVREELRAWKS